MYLFMLVVALGRPPQAPPVQERSKVTPCCSSQCACGCAQGAPCVCDGDNAPRTTRRIIVVHPYSAPPAVYRPAVRILPRYSGGRSNGS